MASLITKSSGFKDADVTFLARVIGEDAVVLQQADVTSITFKVYDTTDDSETGTGTPVVANTIFDTLQTDARWTADSTGYNFKYLIPAASFPVGDRTYRVEFLFTLVTPAGYVFFVVYDHRVRDITTS